jgi:hypothetical protein
MTADRTANSFGHAPNLPGVEFTWSEFVRATQIARVLHSDKPVPAMTPALRARIQARILDNRLNTAELPMPWADWVLLCWCIGAIRGRSDTGLARSLAASSQRARDPDTGRFQAGAAAGAVPGAA